MYITRHKEAKIRYIYGIIMLIAVSERGVGLLFTHRDAFAVLYSRGMFLTLTPKGKKVSYEIQSSAI